MPRDLAVEPGKTVAVCLEHGFEVLGVPDPRPVHAWPWRWHEVRWLDDHTVLGASSDGQLHVADVGSGEIVASLALPSWGRCAGYDRARGILLVTARDRVGVVRVDQR